MAVTVAGVVGSLRTDTSDPYTYSHDQGTTSPQGVIVMAIHGVSTTDHVVGVTYGGVALARLQRNTDSNTELGAAEIWFKGSGIPTGTQTVSADLASGTTDDIFFVSITLDGDGDLASVDNDGINDNVANPSVTLQYTGRTCMAFAAFYSGLPGPASITAGTGCVEVASVDLGNFTAYALRQTTAGSSDFAIAATSNTDDVAFACVAISEKVVESDGASAGVATPASVGAAVFAGVTTSAGAAAADAPAASLLTGVGSGAGVATAASVGGTLYGGVAAADGVASSSVASATVFAGVTASAGVADVSATSGAIAGSAAVSEGVATPAATGAALAGAVAAAGGVAAVAGTAAWLSSVVADAAGVAAGAALSAARWLVTAASAGVAEVLGIGENAGGGGSPAVAVYIPVLRRRRR